MQLITYTKRNISLSLLLLLLSIIPAFSQNETNHLIESEKKMYEKRIAHPPATMAANNSNFIYHRCEWNIDPAINYISGIITTYFIPYSPINTLEFDLSSPLIVDSIQYRHSPVSFNHKNNIITINFPSSLAVNIIDSVSIYYHGIPPESGFGAFIQSTHGPDSAPVIWTLSEPWGAGDWWPCKQNLSDKIDSLDVWITTPTQYKAASNGILKSETIKNDKKTVHWKHRYPIATYLVCLAVTNYHAYSNYVPYATDTLQVLNYVYPEDSTEAKNVTKDVVAQLQLFDSLFGSYPFKKEKYGHAQMGWGGGMEHQTFTFVGGWSFELQAHELAHQWFGDAITCGAWEDIWLNEGFATYLSGLCYEYLSPTWWYAFKKLQIQRITSRPDGSVLCNDTTDINRVFNSRLTYSKGAMLLHTLRWVMGDSAFYKGIRNYFNDPVVKYGFAKTPQFIMHIEQAAGKDLSWFFNDWYHGEGYPSYQIAWEQDATNAITFTIQQTQSNSSVSFFELPLPIKFKNSTQDTTIVVNHTFSGQTFSINLPFKADSLIFDPDLWIISNNNIVYPLGITELKENNILIYPNPTSDYISIDIRNYNFIYQSVSMQIIDVRGKLVKEEVMLHPHHVVDIKNFSKGTYFIQLKGGNIVVNKKVIKD